MLPAKSTKILPGSDNPFSVPLPSTPHPTASPSTPAPFAHQASDESMGVPTDPSATITLTLDELNAHIAQFVQQNPWFNNRAKTETLVSKHLPPVEFHHFGHVTDRLVEGNLPQQHEGQYDLARPESFSHVLASDDLKAPWLESCDIEAMKRFWIRWHRYEAGVKERYAQFGGQVAIQYRVIRFCMEPTTLANIVRYRWKFLGSPDELSDQMIYAYFKTDCEKATSAIAAFQGRVKRELRCDESIKDGASRILCLLASYDRICTECGFPRYYDVEIEPARNHILAALRPEALQKVVRDEVNFSKKRFKAWDDFVGLLIEKMDAWCMFDGIRHPPMHVDAKPAGLMSGPSHTSGERSGKAGGQSRKTKSRHVSGNGNQGSNGTSGQTRPDTLPSGGQTQGTAAPGSQVKSKHPCLKCRSEYHTVWQCPQLPSGDAGVSEAKSLLKAFYDNKRQALPTNRAVVAVPGDDATTACKEASVVGAAHGLVPVDVDKDPRDLLSGMLAAPVSIPISVQLDSGADMTVVTRAFVDKALAAGCDLDLVPLTSPQRVLAFTGDATTIREKVSLNILLPAGSSSVKLQALPCMIQDSMLPDYCGDLLVSRTVMHQLGYDPKLLLQKAGEIQRIWDFSDVQPISGSSGDPPVIGAATAVPTSSMMDDPVYDGLDTCLPTPDPLEVQQREVGEILQERLAEAKANGLPRRLWRPLEQLLHKHRDIFRTAIGLDPPVNYKPMLIKLKENAKPTKCSPRRLPQAQREWLRTYISTLVKAGILYRNDASAWASNPHIVRKPGTNDWRLTIDMRLANDCTEDVQWPMPNMEAIMEHLLGADTLAILDMFKGYWQFLLAAICRDVFSFMTDMGVYTSTRIPTGGKGSVAFYQAAVTDLFEEWLYKSLLIWIDDFLVFAATPDELLTRLDEIFAKCAEVGLKLNPKKCVFYAQEIKWCGRIISGAGVKHDPARIQALVDLPPPATGADLVQFMCASNWMRSHVPRYAEVAQPLQAALLRVYKTAGSNKKSKLVRFNLDGFLTSDELQSFDAMKAALSSATLLAHPDPKQVICIFPDASLNFYGGIVTQVPRDELKLPFAEQSHTPLFFHSKPFRGSQLAWSIPEKEAFALLDTTLRVPYLTLRTTEFYIYVDHANLVYMFDPKGRDPNLPRYTCDKILRWSLILSGFTYRIFHIPGTDNVWADLLSRWGAGQSVQQQRLDLTTLEVSPTLPVNGAIVQVAYPDDPRILSDPEFVWPTLAEISTLQANSLDQVAVPQGLAKDADDGVWRDMAAKIWIPDVQDNDIKTRLVVLAHCGMSGHHGIETTHRVLSDRYTWTNMHDDVAGFCRSCYQCQKSAAGAVVPVPLGSQVHATRPNEVLHFDFLYMGPSTTGEVYVCVLKCDHSGWVQATNHERADVDSFLDAFHRYCNQFGVPKCWVSDAGTHFKNQVAAELCRVYGATHHFTVPHSPWSNGTVEIVNRRFKKLVQCLLSEWQLPFSSWPLTTGCAMKIINHSPSRLLGNRCPITVFTGLPPQLPIDGICHPVKFEIVPYDKFVAERHAELDDLQVALSEMHKDVAKAKAHTRQLKRQAHDRATKATLRQYAIGDFVLVHTTRTDVHKASFHWDGPMTVKDTISDWVYLVEEVRSKKLHQVHVARLKIYNNATKELSKQLLDAIDYSSVTTEVDYFKGYRITEAGEMQLDTVWLGIDGSSWEPVQVMAEDVYLKYRSYMLKALASAPRGSLAHKDITAILREFPIDASNQNAAKAARKGRTQRKRIAKAKSSTKSRTTAKSTSKSTVPKNNNSTTEHFSNSKSKTTKPGRISKKGSVVPK